MRSSARINAILSDSKLRFDKKYQTEKNRLPRPLQEQEEKFKENYFSLVDEFEKDSSNNFNNALSLLIVIEKNKDTLLGWSLIKFVAFPILRMSYPDDPSEIFRRALILKPLMQKYEYSVLQLSEKKTRKEFQQTISTQLSIANTAVSQNIRYLDVVRSHLNFFFTSTDLKKLITDYADGAIVARYDLSLSQVEDVGEYDPKGEYMTDYDSGRAKETGTPILMRRIFTNSEMFFLYGDQDGRGHWKKTVMSPEAAIFLRDLPFDKKILYRHDIQFTDSLMEILREGHIPTIDYERLETKQLPCFSPR